MRIQDKNSKNTSITIHACAESGDFTAFQSLLHQNPSLLNERSNLMVQTPLHIAASLNRVEIVKYLLEWKGPGRVELEAKNFYGETPLHAAAKNGCNESVRMFLDYSANVEAKTNNMMTPLHLAVGYALRSGDNSTVRTLSEYNADCSARDDVGRMRIQDKNSKNTSITIHACAESGDFTAFQSLLHQNPSLLNERSNLMVQTPLHIAASLNRVEIVKYLLEWKGPGRVELEAKNFYGETPLHAAAKNGCNESVRMFLDYSANVEAKTNNMMTPLHLAVGYALRSGDNSTVRTLSEYNADCSARDDEGMTPLNYLPAGVQNEELLGLLCHNVAQQINSITEQVNSFTQQIYNSTGYYQNGTVGQGNYSTTNYYSSTSYSNEEPIKNYDSGIQGKMEEFDYELSKIVGLHSLKEQLRKWAKGMLLDEKRRAMGLNLGPRKPPHMAFLGNPGTGKTTVARILGKLMHSVGVLSSDKVTEVQRTDLVAEYLGQTGAKTRKKIEEAIGGILFVDEAYRLAPKQSAGDHVDFGVEALEEIMSYLEDGQLVVVFAGYTEPMKRVFSSNEGFCRRVTHFFEFDDFSSRDLAEMLMIKMSKQDEKSRLFGFKLHPSCTLNALLATIERSSTQKLRNKMNGGLVDHMLNNARESLDSRLNFDSSGDELLTITLSDLETGLKLLAKRAILD